MATSGAGRKQFRSQSVASSDPRSPYFTCQKDRSSNPKFSRSPSVACVPHYDAGQSKIQAPDEFLRDCDRKRKGRNADIPGLNLKLSPNDPKTSTIRQHYYPEGGWGWIIIACALSSYVLTSALHISVGFFVLDTRQQFLKDQESLEPIILGALSASSSLFLSPVVVALCRRKSTRLIAILGGIITSLGCLFTSFATQLHQLYLSYGIFVGFGESLSSETAAIMLGQYFKRRRELIEIFVMVGNGLGIAAMPLLVNYWIRTMGWRRGLQILAGLQAASCLVAVFYRPASLYHPQRRAILHIKSLQKRSKAKDKMPALEKRPFFDFAVLKSRTVQILMLGTGVTSVGISSPLILMMYEAQREKLDLKDMYKLQIFLGIATSIGAVAFGLVVVKNSVQCMIAKQYLCQAASFLLSGWLLAFPTLDGFHGYVLFVWIYGIFYGGYLYSLKLCVFEKVRARNFARAWSFIQWSQAIPSAIGISLTGYINEKCESKRGFYFSSTFILLGTLILFLIDLHKSHLKTKKIAADMKHCSNMQLQQQLYDHRQSQNIDFGLMLPRGYGDLHKAQELTCISEEILVDNFLEDCIDDCITSCNREEKFLMLSEFENNLFKNEETFGKEKGNACHSSNEENEQCQCCPICSRANDIKDNDHLSIKCLSQTSCNEHVTDNVTTTL